MWDLANVVILFGGVLSCLAVTVASVIDSELWKGDLPHFLCVFKHTKLKNARDFKSFTIGYKDACYYKEGLLQREIVEDVNGEYRTITLSNLKAATFAAQNVYSSQTHSIPILFNTRWQPPNATAILNTMNSVNSIEVLNVSFSTTLKSDAVGSCSGTESVVVGMEWCKWARIFSHHKIKGLPRYNKNGECVLRRSDEAETYLNMWETEDEKDFHTRCYGDNEGCENIDDEGKCLEQVFLANGRGIISKMVLKKYHDNVTIQDYIDVNMIIDFGNWTEEFPRTFANSHKECLYLGDMSKLSVQFFAKKGEDRKPPAQFYAFLVIAFFLGIIVIIALSLVVCTCSTKSFRMELWDYWLKRNAYMKYAKTHASEIAEQAADKRMEKQEALMGGMLGDI